MACKINNNALSIIVVERMAKSKSSPMYTPVISPIIVIGIYHCRGCFVYNKKKIKKMNFLAFGW